MLILNRTPGAPPPNSSSLGYSSLPSSIHPNTNRRRRVLIPGCGTGYDVALFAAYGYDAYGLEVSEHAATAAREYLTDPGEGPLEGEYKVFDDDGRPSEVGWGKMEVVVGDYFKDGWLEQVEGWEGEAGGFDIIYDNTVSDSLLLGMSHASMLISWV